MSKKQTLSPGDRIAYAAAFLKNTRQHTGAAPQRRGTFVRYDVGSPDFARVHWDDEGEMIAHRIGDFVEQDYCDEIRANGSMVHAKNIAKVGSGRFALTCMT